MARLFSLTYTRPKYVEPRALHQKSDSGSSRDCEGEGSVKSGRSGSSTGIPDSLTFDKIVGGGTCPPMTIRNFMNYLLYVEHSAENLQFYLWYHDYVKRFDQANPPERALAPEWTQAMEDDAVMRIRKDRTERMKSDPRAAEIFKGTDFEKSDMNAQRHQATDSIARNPFNTPPHTPGTGGDREFSCEASDPTSSNQSPNYRSQAADAFENAGAKQPFTIQPFREEINRVIATYIMGGAPRQLNLASWEQKAALQALSHTTHPSALRSIARAVDATLRSQAHPNFVRWSICNGNPARVLFARYLGAGLIAAGLVAALVLALSGAGRGFRAIAAAAWVPGVATLVAAYKGMCVVLHGMHHRHVRPWELFVDAEEEGEGKPSFESSGSSNSYEDEPWVAKYERRNVVRKVFDREVWIQEPALRQIQDTIFVQAVLAGTLAGGLLTAIFVAVPGGHFF